MATIQGGNTAQIVDSTNEVLSITKAETYAVAMSDDRGRREVFLAIVFGKASDDKPAVLILNDVEKMREIKVASNKVRDAVRAFMGVGAQASGVEEDTSVPDHLLDAGVGEAPLPKRGRGRKKDAA